MNLTDTPISSTRPHARLSPQSPSGFSGLSEESNGVAFSDEKVNGNGIHTTANENQGLGRAIQMVRDRGVDGADDVVLSSTTSPQTIIRTCEWWDTRPDATPGLLVWRIRQGGVPEEDAPRPKRSKNAWMRDTFDSFLLKHPVGSRLCTHRALAARKWPADREDCAGSLAVDGSTAFPMLVMVCDSCGFEACIGPRDMRREA